jgi:hypothetical protein
MLFFIIAQSAGVNVNATILKRMIAVAIMLQIVYKTPTGPDIKVE